MKFFWKNYERFGSQLLYQICFGPLYLWVIFLIKFVFKFCFSQIFFREGKSRSKKYQTNDIDFHCALFWRQIITEQNSLYIPIFDQYKHLYWSIILYIYIIKEYFVPDSLADCFCTLEILSRNIQIIIFLNMNCRRR